MSDSRPVTDGATPTARAAANSRRFAVATWHPDAQRVDAETWWLAFREGVNWLMQNSAALNAAMMLQGELVVMLADSRADNPELAAAARDLVDGVMTIEDFVHARQDAREWCMVSKRAVRVLKGAIGDSSRG